MDKITFTFIMLAGMILAAVGGFMLREPDPAKLHAVQAEARAAGASYEAQIATLTEQADASYLLSTESRSRMLKALALQTRADSDLRVLQFEHSGLLREHSELVGSLGEPECTYGNFYGQAGVDGEVIVIPVEVCAPSLSIRTLQVGAP